MGFAALNPSYELAFCSSESLDNRLGWVEAKPKPIVYQMRTRWVSRRSTHPTTWRFAPASRWITGL
jgi:hypothetical protein